MPDISVARSNICVFSTVLKMKRLKAPNAMGVFPTVGEPLTPIDGIDGQIYTGFSSSKGLPLIVVLEVKDRMPHLVSHLEQRDQR